MKLFRAEIKMTNGVKMKKIITNVPAYPLLFEQITQYIQDLNCFMLYEVLCCQNIRVSISVKDIC